MKPLQLALLTLFSLCASPLVYGSAHDVTPGVPVKFWGSGYGLSTSTPLDDPGAQIVVTGSGFMAASGGGTVALDLDGSTDSATAEWFDTMPDTMHMEPGKTYTITVNGAFVGGSVGGVALNGAAPLGYKLEIDGVRTQRAELASTSHTFSVRLLGTSEQAFRAAGSCTELMLGRIYWQVGLGSLRNGKAAGLLSIVSSGLEADWSPLYTPSALQYESPSPEVVVLLRTGGTIRQVLANQSIVDVVTSVEDGSLTSTQYELRFYHPDQVASGSGTTPRTFTGDPYITYRIEQGATSTTLKITSKTRDISAANSWTSSVVRTAVTTLARADIGGPGWPDFKWTRNDWNTSGETQVSEQIITSGGSTNNRTDTLVVQPGGGGDDATYLARQYTLYSWGEEITSVTAGSSNGATTTYDYYDNSSEVGRHGFLKKIVNPGGGWETFDYWDATETIGTKRIGTLRYRFKPFKNLPSTPGTNVTQGGEITTYDFSDDPFGVSTRPSLVETKVGDTVTARSTTTYTDATGPVSGTTITEATRKDFHGKETTDFLTTVTKFFREDTEDLFYRNQVHSVTRPDGVKVSYAYQRGDFNETTGAFTPDDEGDASRIATITGVGTGSGYDDYAGYDIDPLSLIEGKSTLEVVIRDSRSLIRRTESHVWLSSAWVLVGWTDFTYDTMGHLTERENSNGTVATFEYTGDQKTAAVAEDGVRTEFEYDHAGRVLTVKKRDVAGTGFTTTVTYGYDAAGRIKSETVSGTGTAETIVNSREYDDAGRLENETPAGLGAIEHAYDVANRTHTVTTADGAETTRTYFMDRRLKKVETDVDESSTTAVFYDYDVESASDMGLRFAEIRYGSDTSARYEKTWDDWLGRRVKTEAPGFSESSQAAMVVENAYDATTGRLAMTTRSGYAPTYYEYDALGQLTRSGLDVAGAAGLDDDSDDRIQESNQFVEPYDGAYWLTTTTATYFPGSSTPTPTSISRLRLTGFSSLGDVVSESRSWDIENIGTTAPTATTTVEIDSSAKEVVTTTTATGLANSGTALSVNGLALSLTTTDGLTYTSAYDALERLKREKNPRHTASGGDIGYKVYTYKTGTAMVEKVTDAAGNDVMQTTYDGLGRPTQAINAEGKSIYSAYNLRGQLIRQWGDATYPVEYEYNTLGERIKMRTWQDSPVDFTSATAFAPANYSYPASTGQATSWEYDLDSGLLWRKTDADNKSVEFDYNVRGQVASRQWARFLVSSGSTHVTTSYEYDEDTGELTDIIYNDDSETIPTPDVGYVYDRLGRVTTITQDGIGTRTFAYDSGSPWRLKDETLPAFFGSRVITALYESATDDDTGSVGSLTRGTVKGRLQGFQLGVAGNTDRDLEHTWKFSNQPRFAAVSAALDEGSPVDFVYDYAANSALVSGYTSGTFAVSREYETNRDLLTRLKTQYGTDTGSVRAQFDYAHDDIGRRVTVLQSGTAYEAYTKGQPYDAIFQVYAYNDRGELESARLYKGDTPTTSPSSGDELPGRRFEYRYDAIGNRTSSGATGTVSASSGVGDDEYTVNDLNQYRYRENNRVALTGTVDAGSALAILGIDAVVPKLDRAWAGSFEPDNGGGPAIGAATIYAADIGGGTAGADLLRTENRKWMVPQRSQELTYDLDGNLIGDGLWTYVYDAENRLVRMTCALASGFGSGYGFKRLQLDFKYDYMGRRIEKRVTDMDDTELLARRFVYDGWNLVAELDGTGADIQRSYVWGLDLTGSLTASGGVGALIQMTNYSSGAPTDSYYPAYDGNGNIVSLVAASDGSLAAIYDYDPSGRIIRHEVYDADVRDNPFRFSTKYFDEETRLVYYGHRYYSAELGRFINRDPIAESGGLNLYGFVGNNAINGYDYLGMDAFMTTIGVSANGAPIWMEGDGATFQDMQDAFAAMSTAIATPARYDQKNPGSITPVMDGYHTNMRQNARDAAMANLINVLQRLENGETVIVEDANGNIHELNAETAFNISLDGETVVTNRANAPSSAPASIKSAGSTTAPNNQLLVGIDGTNSTKWLDRDQSGRATNSHVFNLVGDFNGPKLYLPGPNILGTNVNAIADQALAFIHDQLRANPDLQINIVGHSRGGLIGIDIANQLSRGFADVNGGATIQVNFLGLFDAVDRAIGMSGSTINNVNNVLHIVRDPEGGSRTWFGNTGRQTGSGVSYEEVLLMGTHSAIGGGPGAGDFRRTNIPLNVETSTAAEANRRMREAAERAGLSF